MRERVVAHASDRVIAKRFPGAIPDHDEGGYNMLHFCQSSSAPKEFPVILKTLQPFS
jgi:hypothetical protein